MTNKVLLVGWDAADWKLIQPLVDAGLMPTTRRLIEGGVMADLLTLSPILSPVLWTTIATGKRPHKHGILGFTEPMPSGVGVRPITNLSRKTKAIWNILSQNGMKSNVVGWWPSNPAEPINGVMVSNLYQGAGQQEAAKGWPLKPGTVHPPAMSEALAALRIHPQDITAEEIRPFVPEGHKVDQLKDKRLWSVVKTLAECASIQACAMHLMETEPWDFMAVYFDAIDHFCHGFMRYHPPRLDWVSPEDFELYKNVVTAGYVFHDMMLGHMLALAGEDTTVIVVSDHGFHPDHMRRKELPNEPAGPATEHREHGMFLIHGPGIKRDTLIHGVSLLDITPTVLSLFDLPLGEDMDGKALTEVYAEPRDLDSIPSWDDVPGDAGCHPADLALEVDDSEEAMEQLVALGYIERQSGDGREAAARAATENTYNLARSYMHAGMHGEAVPLLADLYTQQPLEFRFGIQLAICLQAMDQVDDLAELIGDLRHRWVSAAKRSRERLAEVADIAKERKALLKQLEARRAAERGDDADAEDRPKPIERIFSESEQHVITKLRSIARGNVSALDYMDGWVLMARGDYPAALALFKQAENPEAAGTGYHYQMGEAYRNLGREDEAVASYRRVLELDPHDSGAHLGLARAYIGTFQYDKAQDMARAALALKYHLPPAHYIFALCRAAKGDFREAVNALNTALELNPNYADAHERLAEIWGTSLGDHEKGAAHRALVGEIKTQQAAQRTQHVVAGLPHYDAIDYNETLPVFPRSDIVPRLGDAPVHATPKVADPQAAICVVSGLPRSGTSMLMQMLVAAGIPPLTDGERQADENNPRGYFELDKVRRLPQANDWLDEARGTCIKVVSPLVPHLPQGEAYRVILIERDLDEISSSQQRMLSRLDKSGGALTDASLKDFLAEQNSFALKRLEAHAVPSLVLSHAETMQDPRAAAQRIASFIGVDDPDRIAAMSAVVDADLYRERGTERTNDAA